MVGLTPRHLQAAWVSLSSDDVSQALGSLRNIFSPNVKVGPDTLTRTGPRWVFWR